MELKTFEDPSYCVEIEIAPGCQVTAHVAIKPEEMKLLYKKAVKLVNKQISVPGFRKGKAPDSAIVHKYASYIEKEWKDLVIQSGVQKTIELSQLPPFSERLTHAPRLIACDQETGGKISFSYEHAPKIPDIDFGALTIESIPLTEVTDEEVQKVVNSILSSEATHEEIDKAVEGGDYIRITIQNTDTQVLLLDHYLLHIEIEKIVPWLKQMILGMKAGEEKEGTTEGDLVQPVKVTVHQVLKAIVPELSEEIAKKVGASSVEDLLSKIRKNLEKEEQEEQRGRQLIALDTALMTAIPFELPASWVQKEIQARTQKYLENVTPTEEERAAMDVEMAQKAEKALRIHFLHQKLIAQHRTSITQDDLNLALLRARIESIQTGRSFNENLSAEELDELRFSLIRRKAREHTLDLVLGLPLSTDEETESVS